MLLLALPDCDFVRIQDFLAISRIYEFKARFELNVNLLALIQFYFFWGSIVSSINFHEAFWKCSNAENVKLSSTCATNGSQGEQVSQQYI